MQVFSINYQEQQNKVGKQSTLKYCVLPLKPIVFEGALTRLAKKTPNVSPDLMRAMNGIYKRDNGFVGVFPPEFINAIKTNLGEFCSPQKIKDCIEGVKKTFAESTKFFDKVENETNKNIENYYQNLNYKTFLKAQIQDVKQKISTNFEKQAKACKKFNDKFLPDNEFIQKIEKQLSNIIESGFKKNKIIPNDATVIVKKLDSGRYGTAYKISFIDKNNKIILKDKVIKYYKNLETNNLVSVNWGLKRFEIIKGNYNEFTSFSKRILNILSFAEKTFKILSKKNIIGFEKYKNAYLSELKKYKSRTIDEQKEILIDRVKNNLKNNEKTQGINRETNIGNYIKKAYGNNLQRSDLIEYYYSDLNNNYALLDFSSYNNLGIVTKKVDYDSLGIEPKDIVMVSKFTNFVDNRLVDYGGFEVTNEVLAENSVARRIYKKIKHIGSQDSEKTIQQRITSFNELWNKAINNKISQSYDVLLGLEEARKLIPKNKQTLLHYNKSKVTIS